jgi:hypothetical protein
VNGPPTVTRGSPDRFRRSAIPVAVVALLAAGLGFGLEAALPGSGLQERQADPQFATARWLRVGSAVALSAGTFWLARGLLLDRKFVRAPDDRLASEYLAAGALSALFSAMTGALVGVVVSVGVIAGVAVGRRDSADPSGTPGRDLRNAAMLALAGGVLLLGAPESILVWAKWQYGFGAAETTLTAYADRFGLSLIRLPLLGVAAACAMAVPTAIWRHRRRLDGVRGLAVIAAGVVAAMGALATSVTLLILAGLTVALIGVLLLRAVARTDTRPD